MQFFEAWHNSVGSFNESEERSLERIFDKIGFMTNGSCQLDFVNTWYDFTCSLTRYIDSSGINGFVIFDDVHACDLDNSYFVYDDFDLKPLFMWCFDVRWIRKRCRDKYA